MPRITKRFIDGLRPKPDCDLFAWDSELHGFGIRMKPSGRASRLYAFVKVGTLTPDEARTKARKLLVDVEAGNDPSTQGPPA